MVLGFFKKDLYKLLIQKCWGVGYVTFTGNKYYVKIWLNNFVTTKNWKKIISF